MNDAHPTHVVTTEHLLVRRFGDDGSPHFEVLAAGARCEVVGDDDVPGTYLLVDERGDEVWRVLSVQFTQSD